MKHQKIIVRKSYYQRTLIFFYTKAIENDHLNAEAWYNRGVAKIKLSQKENGCLDLKESAGLKFEKAVDLFEKYCQ